VKLYECDSEPVWIVASLGDPGVSGNTVLDGVIGSMRRILEIMAMSYSVLVPWKPLVGG
jgi:hypothetical protein